MMHLRRWLRRGLAGVGVAAPLALAPILDVTVQAAEPVVTESGQMAGLVDVEGLESDGATVSGMLVNRSRNPLRNLRVGVRDTFLWTNEPRPGSDDPSSATEYAVAGPIPPRGSVPFKLERRQPLPSRPDGTFKTDVSVLSVIRQPT